MRLRAKRPILRSQLAMQNPPRVPAGSTFIGYNVPHDQIPPGGCTAYDGGGGWYTMCCKPAGSNIITCGVTVHRVRPGDAYHVPGLGITTSGQQQQQVGPLPQRPPGQWYHY